MEENFKKKQLKAPAVQTSFLTLLHKGENNNQVQSPVESLRKEERTESIKIPIVSTNVLVAHSQPQFVPAATSPRATGRRLYRTASTWDRVEIIKRGPSSLALPTTLSPTSSVQSPAASFVQSFNRQATFSISSEDDSFAVGDEIGEYSLVKEIGAGAFGRVFEAASTSGEGVAIKVTKEDVKLWRTLSHPNIVELKEVIEVEDTMLIVCDLADSTILKYIEKGVSENEAKSLFKQMAEGVAYLHDLDIVHHDIKLENILLKGGVVKIADFGMAEKKGRLKGEVRHLIAPSGSLHYLAPEELTALGAGTACDIWALGCCLYGMVTGKLPFTDSFLPRLQMRIMAGKFDPVPGEVGNLISKMLDRDLELRYDIHQVLAHKWLN